MTLAFALPEAAADRLVLRVDAGLRIVNTADIHYCETDGNYVRVHAGDGSLVTRITAMELEHRLNPRRFMRIHRRYIVNLDRVVEVRPLVKGDATVVLHSGTRIRMSRAYRKRLHARLRAPWA